jgi:hypothetical protein
MVPALAFLLAIGVQVTYGPASWVSSIWLLVWAQVGAALYWRSRSQLQLGEVRQVTTLIVVLGGLGIAVVGFVVPWHLSAWTIGSLWIGTATLLWRTYTGRALGAPAFALVAEALNVPRPLILVGVLVVFAVALHPALARPSRKTLTWSIQQTRFLLMYGVYGCGQALLMYALLRGAGWNAAPGLAVYLVMIVAAEVWVVRLKGRLADMLWAEAAERRFASRAWRSMLEYTLYNALPLLVALGVGRVLGADTPWIVELGEFSALGLVVALGLAHLTLTKPSWAAVAFAVAGGIAVAGFPHLLATALLAVALVVVLCRQITQVSTYGLNMV